jgi:hypothetical protein
MEEQYRGGLRDQRGEDRGKSYITQTKTQDELEKAVFEIGVRVSSLLERFEERYSEEGEVSDSVILSSPDGTKFRIQVSDLGALVVSPVE